MQITNPQQIHTRNTIFNAAGEGLWGFAMAFHNMNSVIPMFLAQMGASAFVLGLIPGGFILLVALPQLLSAYLFHQSPHIKKLNIGLHFAMAPIAFLIGMAFYYFEFVGQTGIMVYLILWVIWSLSVGFLVPVWADFLASVTVASRRGRFFGITFTVNAIMGMIGGYVLKEVLSMDSLSFPSNFGAAFLIMTTAILIGNIFFFFIKVIHPPTPKKEQVDHWWQRLKTIYIQDRNFRNYIYSRALAAATMMPLAFYGVDLQDRFDLPLSSAGTFTFFLVVGQAIFNIVFGYIGDIYGRKMAIGGFFLGHFLAGITAILATEPWMAYLTFVFVGMGFGAGQSSFMVFVYEFAGELGDRKLYYAALDTAVAPVIIVYISIAGLIVETFGTIPLYALSLAFVITGLLVFIYKVEAPTTS
ncbi:MAG: MFS transporter [Candidatus Marinimicrobia bacterium]|jgi:MFS family permease|nr:MFS transporter [Candidatus Neomarinimicrobiota bacterium]MBT4360020.1 MFS transporter [Candidatus Neomarinimicrobiota bacterium]MBT4714917.1 MFS transporter [Candidatus Neomarinimicrobiota bacterium]MBT4945692.1 MFS transporter [Candidatus Neomarinimicrobiota bacterium]MBT5269289.1 MFS transporter [Candidatus Neomarinimicrobiota bacterium]